MWCKKVKKSFQIKLIISEKLNFWSASEQKSTKYEDLKIDCQDNSCECHIASGQLIARF